MSATSQIMIPSKKLIKMVWDIYSKFYDRGGAEKAAKFGKKIANRNDVLADIYLFCLQNFKPNRLPDDLVDASLLGLIWKGFNRVPDEIRETDKYPDIDSLVNSFKANIPKDPSDSTRKSTVLVCDKSLQQFEGRAHEALHIWNGDVQVNITWVQLHVLHLYAYGRPYSNQIAHGDNFYLRDKQIYLIETHLKDVFMEPLSKIFQALREASENGGSQRLLKMASELFAKKIDKVCEELAKLVYTVEGNLHLATLMNFMEICSGGFGVNIPRFEKHWDDEDGNGILEINKKQKEGSIATGDGKFRDSFQYIRIFFVEGADNQNPRLTEEETKMILKQLEHKVKIILVFPGAWSGIDISKLDFAVLRIDECPALIGTTFLGDATEAVFHLDDTKAEKHFNQYLKDILVTENSPYIYEAVVQNDVIVLNPLGEWGIIGLSGELSKICTPSPKRNGYQNNLN